MKKNISTAVFNIIIFLFIINQTHAQEPGKEDETGSYESLYNNNEYIRSLEAIRIKLQAVYDRKNDYLKIPDDLIFIEKRKDRKDLNDLFRRRKIDKYFIEENPELFKLHLFAARCYFKTDEYNASLNHFYNSLRYKELQEQQDAYIFYEISQVYKNSNMFNAYINTLETACSLNPFEYNYSLELGKSLSSTPQTKKAIFHLERYIESKGDDVNESLFFTVGNLYEDTGNFLETARYYQKYLGKKPDDGYVNYALGYIAYKKIGNHNLALQCLNKSLELLPENDFFRRSKASEYQGDIYLGDREFDLAKKYYNDTKIYHDKIMENIRYNNKKISDLEKKIQEIRSELKSKAVYERYNEYQSVKEEKANIELANRELRYSFSKLNSGYIRWTLAELFERTEEPEQAIKYYSEAITYNYNANNARERINKLKLKINRGY
ncbi:MAG: hypothetical protein JW864_13235 [Spirochaetes bacterium]|nr:hypothetical protein [Spirochaetota bacterium]